MVEDTPVLTLTVEAEFQVSMTPAADCCSIVVIEIPHSIAQTMGFVGC